MSLNRTLIKIARVAIIPRRMRVLLLTICLVSTFGNNNIIAQPNLTPATLTNASQVSRVNSMETSNFSIRLEGTVLWINPARDCFVLQDKSGGVAVRLDLSKQPDIYPRQEVLVEGTCKIERNEIVPSWLLIDNDGIHASTLKSATLYLTAGMHPISAEWFNFLGAYAMEVDCKGPNMPRQEIPTAMLYRKMNPTDKAGSPVHGLDYSCYEGDWDRLPDFSQLPAVRRGFITNFDLQVRTRDIHVGIVYSGYFMAPRSGEYSFWLTSDDGSKLYIADQPLQISNLGKSAFPVPCQVVPGQPILQDKESQWSEVEGIVTHINETSEGIASIEVTADTGRAYLKIMNARSDYLNLLLHCRIMAKGVSQNACNIDGQIVPSLLVPDSSQITIINLASEHWDCPLDSIRSLIETNLPPNGEFFAHIAGTVISNSLRGCFSVKDETGIISIDSLQASPHIGEPVEVLGEWNHEGSRVVLQNSFYRGALSNTNSHSEVLPVLSKVIQVKSLSRTEAMRGYPVKIQGVITARFGSDFVIQDSTWSIYCYWYGGPSIEGPDVGDYWEIEGNSGLGFAPDIVVSHAAFLHPGILPEPLHPTRAELINDSLDTKYIEIDGIASGATTNDLTLLTQDGTIEMELDGITSKTFEKLDGSLIRVRGVACPPRGTNQMMLLPVILHLRLFSASISVDEPPPQNPFEIPLKSVSDLLHFDVQADALRRVRVAGQVLHERNGEYFLMDGAYGLRFNLKSPVNLQAGDMVDVVGFLDLSKPSPVLREAIARVIRKSTLPSARRLSSDALLSGQLDSTLVCIKSLLVGLSGDHADQILELQAGTRNYVARLAKGHGTISDIPLGSILDITGVYAGQGGNWTSGQDVDSFELLLNSPSDIRVLAKPSWWTFRHTVTVIAIMALAMLAGIVWITQLHRQVRRQTLQLASEIKTRQKAEHQRAIEKERARIASDLHDELGATLTEIRFLGAVKGRDLSLPQATRSRLEEMSEKARQMVSSLDEIVWAINPSNDSVPNLVRYLCHVAEEFGHVTGIRYRLDVDPSLPLLTLTSESRHNVYLAVRETMNNIAKHSGATEVLLRIYLREHTLHVSIEDNGCGFSQSNDTGNGLSNMYNRLEKIGGCFEYNSQPGLGTVCLIRLPLIQNNYEN